MCCVQYCACCACYNFVSWLPWLCICILSINTACKVCVAQNWGLCCPFHDAFSSIWIMDGHNLIWMLHPDQIVICMDRPGAATCAQHLLWRRQRPSQMCTLNHYETCHVEGAVGDLTHTWSTRDNKSGLLQMEAKRCVKC